MSTTRNTIKMDYSFSFGIGRKKTSLEAGLIALEEG